MWALSIRQPYAELILRGINTIEYRTRPTRIIGQEFYIYVPKTLTLPTAGARGATPRSDPGTDDLAPARSQQARGVWSEELAVPGRYADALPRWMIELAEQIILGAADLPRGLLVGTTSVTRCVANAGRFDWHLGDVKRLPRPRKPTRHPQPMWFNPF